MEAGIADYELIEILHQSARTTIHRGVRKFDGVAVVIKRLSNEYPLPRDLAQLRREFRVARRLRAPGVIDVYALEPRGNGLALVAEDFGGTSLSGQARPDVPVDLETFFTIALALTRVLVHVHQQIIHGDVSPANVLWNPRTRDIRLIDFGASSEMRREPQRLLHDGLWETSLPYLAPERSGRMNRDLDHRTDLYSLGATFYELLAGAGPFAARSRAEWIYCHVTRQPRPPHESAPGVPEMETLIEEHQLLTRVTRQQSGADETAVIGRVGEAIGRCDVYADIPVLLATALADGLSLEGAGEALSIGAAGLFLRSLTGNPMDVHLHTSANLRRYLIGLDGLSLHNKLLVLLLWHTGPEIRSTQRRMQPAPQPDPDAVAALPYRTQDELLEALTASIYQQPPTDWVMVANLGQLRAAPEVKETVNLAQQYVQCGYDATALITRLAEIVCHDNFTEMHAFKHHQAIVEEFYATREPWRWLHLVSGAQAAAISFGKNMEIYEEALEMLHA